MAKYRVITIAVAVKNNRIASFNEFVDDSELTANPLEMIQAGSIELVSSDDVEIEVEQAETGNIGVEEVKESVSEVVETKEVVSKKDKVKAKLDSK